jgi:hypothetical protein
MREYRVRVTRCCAPVPQTRATGVEGGIHSLNDLVLPFPNGRTPYGWSCHEAVIGMTG